MPENDTDRTVSEFLKVFYLKFQRMLISKKTASKTVIYSFDFDGKKIDITAYIRDGKLAGHLSYDMEQSKLAVDKWKEIRETIENDIK